MTGTPPFKVANLRYSRVSKYSVRTLQRYFTRYFNSKDISLQSTNIILNAYPACH